MASIFDPIDSALEEAERYVERASHDPLIVDEEGKLFCPRGDATEAAMFYEMWDGLRFLSVFVECIYKWTDAEEVVPHLGTLASKIEGTILKIGDRVLKDRKLVEVGESKAWHNVCKVIASSNREIDFLKPEIGVVCETLSRHSLMFRLAVLDFGLWKKYFPYMESCLVQVIRNYGTDDPQREQVEAFMYKLTWTKNFLDSLADGSPTYTYPRFEDFTFHLGGVFFSAALLSCHWWATGFDPNAKHDMSIAFCHLQQNIWFTNSEFTDTILRLLKTFNSMGYNRNQRMFLMHLLPFVDNETEICSFGKKKHYRLVSNTCLLSKLWNELLSLITYFGNIPEHHVVNKENSLTNIKMLVMEIASLNKILSEVNENGTLVLDLLSKTWIIWAKITLEQVTAGDIILHFMKMEINALNQAVGEIKKSQEVYIENMSRMLKIMEEVTKTIAYLGPSCGKGIRSEMVRNVLSKLLLMILLFWVELFSSRSHENNKNLVVSVKDRIEPLHKRFKSFMKFVTNLPEGNVECGGLDFAHIELVTRAVISLCHSFLSHTIGEERIKNMNLLLFDLLDEIAFVMMEHKETCFRVPRSNFPKTVPVGFIDTLLRKLMELLNYKNYLFLSVRPHIEDILHDLEFFRDFLGHVLGQDLELPELKYLRGCVIDVTYEAEYLIDSFVGEKEVECHIMLWLYLFLQETRFIKVQVYNVVDKNVDDVKVHISPWSSRNMVAKATNPGNDEAVLGLDDEEQVVIDRLVAGVDELDIISIVGMAGIGKTTFAKKIYNSPIVLYHFHIRAWGCVSEVYRKRDLLLQILSHLTAITDEVLELSDEGLELKVYRLLKLKRFLITLDDMWSTEAWDDLEKSFPNDGNGSRILITSRLRHVTLKAKGHFDPHPLRLLSDAESWKLLKMKIFHEECCPEELMEIGEGIAKICKGLPLTIVTVAGVLRGMARQRNRWMEIAKGLSSCIIDDPLKQCLEILELSYKHLPSHLKPCFLYLGAFPGHKDIPVQKLMWLWMAEGFVQRTELKNLEDLAEDYLMDLIGRSMVMFAQGRSRGGIKTCRIHDMFRTLCLSKAKEENFLEVIANSGNCNDAFDDLDYGVDFSYPSHSPKYECHRLCICSKRKHFVMSRPSGPCVRSLLLFATDDMYPRCPYDISFLFHNFKLLKVLDLECINMGTCFHTWIELLVHLRYLAVSGDIDSVPSSIANLWNLETFVVKGFKGKVKLPDTIWCLAKLRHVRVNNLAFFIFQDEKLGSYSQLDSLVTLSSPAFFHGEDANNILRLFPNLLKLRCVFLGSRDNSENCNQFAGVKFPVHLEVLKISYYGRALHPSLFHFPLNLRKLTLSKFHLPWDKISIIGRLQNLEVLKLLSGAFDGKRWDMMEGEFSKLKYLKLETLNIVTWNATFDHLPNLQQLVLQSCKHLEEVPPSFVEIPTLQMIEVQWCSNSVEDSVRKMWEEGVEGLKVFINHADLDR